MWVVWFGNEYIVYPEDQVIIDLGANIGAFTILAAQQRARIIIAVEPFPESCRRLRENVTDYSSVRVIEAAVDSKVGTLFKSVDAAIPSDSKSVHFIQRPGDCIAISTVTLENLISSAGCVDYLKMDIEGHEYALLVCTPDHVLQQIKRIGLEYHGDSGHELVRKRLEPCGFSLTRHLPQMCRGVMELTRKV
jgi:FkbM family methyltransferase